MEGTSKNCQNCRYLKMESCYPLETEPEVICRGRIYGVSNEGVPRFGSRDGVPKVRSL